MKKRHLLLLPPSILVLYALSQLPQSWQTKIATTALSLIILLGTAIIYIKERNKYGW